jgi:hypothetical protein
MKTTYHHPRKHTHPTHARPHKAQVMGWIPPRRGNRVRGEVLRPLLAFLAPVSASHIRKSEREVIIIQLDLDLGGNDPCLEVSQG